MSNDITLRSVNVSRYILPLREGGSLPALAEADDGFKYVLKFRGAGHGTKMLISELLGGKIASVLGLNIPELVLHIWMKILDVQKVMKKFRIY